MNIKISIITVTYNSEETIRETLESVHGQSYSDIEHIISDCCSSDRSLDIVKDFPVNKIVSEPDRGIYDAMNNGINYATGDIIGFLNSDDVFEDKESIKNIANEFKNENQLDIVFL